MSLVSICTKAWLQHSFIKDISINIINQVAFSMRTFLALIFILCNVLTVYSQAKTDDSTTCDSCLAQTVKLIEIGSFHEAEALAKKSIQTCDTSLGIKIETYANSLNILAYTHQELGKYDEALKVFLEAHDILKKIKGGESSTMESILFNIGTLYEISGKYFLALEKYQEGIKLTIAIYGKEHEQYTVSLSNIAGVYAEMGDNFRAIKLYEEILEISRKTIGEEHSKYAIYLNNLALVYQKMGWYNLALPIQIQAAEITKKNLGETHISYGIRLENLSVSYKELGLYDKALEANSQSLAITNESLGKDNLDYSIGLHNRATIFRFQGKHEEAIRLYLKSIDIMEDAFGELRTYYQLNNLGSIYVEKGEYERAEYYFQKAIGLISKHLGEEHPFYGTSLVNITQLYLVSNQIERGITIGEKALKLIEKNYGLDHDIMGTLFDIMAKLYWQKKDTNMTLSFLKKGFAYPIKNIKRNFSVLSEIQNEHFLKNNFQEHFDMIYSLAWEGKSSHLSELALNQTLLLKELLLQSNTQRQEFFEHTNDLVIRELFDEWTATKYLLSSQYSRPLSQRNFSTDSLENEIEELATSLSIKSNHFSPGITQTDWKEVAKRLDTNETVIEFVHFRYANPFPSDDVFYMALLIRKDWESPILVPLFEEMQLQKVLSQKYPDDSSFVSQLYGPALYDLIWNPLMPYLKKGGVIYYSPSGLLHRISFPAIPSSDKAFLLDEYSLTYVSSSRKLIDHQKPEFPSSGPIIVYGNITYDSDTSYNSPNIPKNTAETKTELGISSSLDGATRGRIWRPLPKSLTELIHLELLFKENQREVFTLQKASATEGSFHRLQQLPQSPAIIHLATHGFFYPDPEFNEAERTKYSIGGKFNFQFSDNPLFRSGIIMAGANSAWRKGEIGPQKEDGILTAYEIAEMDLYATQLVVLSACNTGIGEIRGSEGVYGLQRAFKRAGVDYLLLTLWSIPDSDQTVEFMKTFYQNWFSRKPIRQAFNQTQLAMRKKYNDPYYWAGFVLID